MNLIQIRSIARTVSVGSTISITRVVSIARTVFVAHLRPLYIIGLILMISASAHAKFQMTKASGSRRKIPKVTLHEIQLLDSQIQGLNLPIDASLSSAQPGNETTPTTARESARSCSIDAKTRDSLLASKRQTLDQKISDFVAPKIHAQGTISIADASWPKDCAKSCHCAVYKSILEVAGSERLSENDRRIYQKLTDLAMNQPVSERSECAKDGLKEICKTGISK